MNRINLIIDALESAYEDKAGWCDKVNEALYAARDLRDQIYAKEMEQPTPTQSGIVSIKDTRQPWYKYVTDEQLLNEVTLRGFEMTGQRS